MIALQDIHVTFNAGTVLEKQALKGITLQIEEGDFVTVVGSNGAGKSTLLGVLTGEVSPTHGQIFVDGVEATTMDVEQRSSWLARVFQDPLMGTCGALSVIENMALAASRGGKRGFRSALAADKLDHFKAQLARLNLGLEQRLHDPIGALSGGQRQAISLIMTALSPMRLLVLDEHTAALDPHTAAFILSITREMVSEQKLTVLMVTHSMHQALEEGNRTLMLHDGRVVLDLSDAQRRKLNTDKLLQLLRRATHGTLDDDGLLADL
ncbi:MAG: ABC transporter ATP-binding protein [Holosporales bacterium]